MGKKKNKMVETKTLVWLEEALLRRKAQESSVVLFQSTDPERINQFRNIIEKVYQKTMLSENEKIEKFFLYDPFTGLLDAKTGEAIKTTTSGPLAGLIPGNGKIKDINAACDMLEEHMTSYTTLALIQGLSTQKEPLQYALRAFATNGEVYKTKSTVFIFAPTASAVLDDYTRDLAVVIDIPISLEQERKEIADKIARELGIKAEPSAILSSAGLDLHMTESAFLESVFRKKNLDAGEISKFKADVVRKSGLLELQRPTYGFEAVGGMNAIRRFINNTIIKVLKEPSRVNALGLRPPRGILLFGPPGTGKTLLALSLAKEINLVFANLRLENIYRSLVGETESRLNSALKIVEATAPCIVFLDEIDKLSRRGDISTDSGVSSRVTSSLLEYLGSKDRKSIIVGTTNYPERIDEAMLRAGRFDYKIYVGFPDEQSRCKILQIHTQVVRKMPLAEDVDLNKVAAATELYTGAELEELAIRAARKTFIRGAEKVSKKDFDKAFTSFKIDIKGRREQLSRYLNLAEKYTDDTDFLQELKQEATYTRLDAAKAEINSDKLKEELKKI